MEIKLRGVIVGESGASDVVIRDGRIVAVSPAGTARADLGSRRSVIGPTLFDIQVNGACGVDLQRPDLAPVDLARMTGILASWGVSYWIPTLITGPLGRMERACRIVAEAMQDPAVGRAVPGLHIEGPYISPVDGPRGAHAREFVRPPSIREFDRLMRASGGKIVYTTIAPELDGAPRYIKALVERGVTVSLGHHNGNADAIARAVDAGARLCTHLGNGLASTIHRHQNPLWPQLAEDRLAATLIADLEHLPAAVLKTFVRAKGPERIILTSDCVHIAGLKPGKYCLGSLDVELLPSGRICLTGTDLLAGSSLMLLQGVVNAAAVTDLTLAQAFDCACTIPVRLLGLKRRFPLPTIGAKADLVLFDIRSAGSGKREPVIRCVFVNGERKA